MAVETSTPLSACKVLVVVAHPDDAESFCGGTIARLSQGGSRVSLVLCSNGDRGSHDCRLGPTDLTRLRREEQHEAQAILGVHEVIWFGYRDGELTHAPDLRDRLVRVIRQIRPEVILTFDPWKHYEFHPDHRAVGFVACEARMLADLPWICPEDTLEGLIPWHPAEMYLFAPQEANYWVDISSTIDLKVRARLVHRSQNDFICCEKDTQAFADFIKDNAAQAAAQAAAEADAQAGKTGGMAYAEAFHKVDSTGMWI
jgi:LmbE family N-acetylglucosaminyl deacetylase